MSFNIPEHSTRHKVFIGINIFLILIAVWMCIIGGFIVTVMILALLGVIQLISAISGAIRDNKAKARYLMVSIVFLLVYAGVATRYLPLPYWISDLHLSIDAAIYSPLIMAIVYTFILIFTPSAAAKTLSGKDNNLLDDDLF